MSRLEAPHGGLVVGEFDSSSRPNEQDFESGNAQHLAALSAFPRWCSDVDVGRGLHVSHDVHPGSHLKEVAFDAL